MAGIFLVEDDDRLTAMGEQPYDSEDVLQTLLARYPDLLAGDQMTDATPKRWLLIQREVGVPAQQAGPDLWSVDHVFLDQQGVPTIVEVKRSTDSRLRREVVGQMLDYAANGVVYWPADRLRARHEATCEASGLDPAAAIRTALGTELDVDELWERVATNLQAGRIRMVFVADVIPPELERVVDFLASQFRFAEVFAVEVKQFVGGGHTALVPRLVGRRRKPVGPGEPWTEERFLVELEKRKGGAVEKVASRLIDWGRSRGWQFWWGQGQRLGSCYFVWPTPEGQFRPFSLWTDGGIWLEGSSLLARHELSDQAVRQEIIQKLQEVGFSSRSGNMDKNPTMAMSRLQSDSQFHAFIEAMQSVAHRLSVESDDPDTPPDPS